MRTMKGIDLNVLCTEHLYRFYLECFRFIENDDRRREKIVEHIHHAAMAKVVDFKPDLILVMALSPIGPWFIENAKQLGVITAHWYVENFRYYPSNPLIPRWQTIAPYYDYFFTIQQGSFFEALQALGIVNYHYIPTGCNPKIHHKSHGLSAVNQAYGADICFIGHPYSNRVTLFKELQEFNIALWGPGWSDIPELKPFARGNGQMVNTRQEAEIIKHAKIGFNIHSSLSSNEPIQCGDFLNPRVFTIAACGTFQLVDEQEPLSDVFDSVTEVAVYHDIASLKTQLKRFLENPPERQQMADRAYERTHAEHTYWHRAEQMLGIIGML